jgi:hypothetical protein
MTKAHEIYMEVLANLKAKAKGDWGIYVLYQPLPPSYWRDSASKGGNVLGLERFNGQVLCRESSTHSLQIHTNILLQYTNRISLGREQSKMRFSRLPVQASSTGSATMLRASRPTTLTFISTMRTVHRTPWQVTVQKM